MRTAPIGYYVHHHGAGHAHRYSNIAAASEHHLVPISQLDLAGGVRLASDVVRNGRDPSAGGSLHWSPVGDRRSARRSLAFGRWLTEATPAGVVVDVSVEAALLCRLFGVPTVIVRQHGDRTDGAHEMAYRSAAGLLAPFPGELEHDTTPEWVRAKTSYAGFIGAGADRTGSAAPPAADLPGAADVLVLWGAGGGALDSAHLSSIVRAARPGRVWFAGRAPIDLTPLAVRDLGWVDDVRTLLSLQPTVVGSAGNNVVADAAAAGCALVVVPQPRPFDEQIRHGERLDRRELAAVVRCETDIDWAAALATARRRRPALASLAAVGGARVAAQFIADTFVRPAVGAGRCDE